MMPLTVSKAGASELTSLSLSVIERAIDAGTLPVRHHGNRLLIRVADLQRWVDSLPAGRPEAPAALDGKRVGRPRKHQPAPTSSEG